MDSRRTGIGSHLRLSASPGTGHSSELVLRKQLPSGTEMRLSLCTKEASGCGSILTTDTVALSNIPRRQDASSQRWGLGGIKYVFFLIYAFGCMKSAAAGSCCGMWDLLLWSMDFLVVVRELYSCGAWTLLHRT